MNFYLNVWIFTCGLLFKLQCASSDTTITDSSDLNLVIDSSTDSSINKQLQTNFHNSSDSFSSNNVNTGSQHSSQTTEDCRNSDCSKHLHSYFNNDNSSSASKILWNLVSTAKTVQPSSSDVDFDLESTVPSLNTVTNVYSSDHSNQHNSSFYSSDNELDSEINFENHLLAIPATHSDDMKSSTVYNSDSENSTISVTVPTILSTEIKNDFNNVEENDTITWESTEIHSKMLALNDSSSDLLNTTDYTTPPSIQETTLSTEDELDFTTYFSNSSHSFGENTMQEFAQHSNPSNNLTIEVPTISTNVPLKGEYNESSTFFSGNYDASTESEEDSLNDNKITDSVSRSSYSMSKIPLVLENKENSTSFYLNYDTSLEAEELNSNTMQMINISDLMENADASSTISDTTSEEIFLRASEGIMFGLSTYMPIAVELSTNNDDLVAESTTLSSSLSSVEETSDKTDSTTFKNSDKILWREAADIPTESAEEVDYAFNSTKETQEASSESSQTQTLNLLYYSSETSTTKYFSSKIPTTAGTASTEILNFSLYQEGKTSHETTAFAATENMSDYSANLTENSSDLSIITYDLPISEVTKQNLSLSLSNKETDHDNENMISTQSSTFSTVESIAHISNDSTKNASDLSNVTFSYDLPTYEILKQNLSHNQESFHETENKISTQSSISSTIDTISNTSHDSTESFAELPNMTFPYDLPIAEIMNQNLSLFANKIDINHENEVSTSSYNDSVTTDPNINVEHFNVVQGTSTQTSNYSINLNEIETSLPFTENNHGTISSESGHDETSTVIITVTESSVVVLPVTASNFKEASYSDNLPDITTSGSSFDSKMTSEYSDEISTSTENSESKTYISTLNPDIISNEKVNENDSTTTETLVNTELASLKMHIENTDQIMTDKPEVTSSTQSFSASEKVSIITNNTTIYFSDNIKPTSSESSITDTEQTENSAKTSMEKGVNISDSGIIPDLKHFDTIPVSVTHEIETTLPTSSETSSLSVTETYREGKHIPFSSTIMKSTTQYPKLFNNTGRTYSHPPQAETTENNFVNLLYNQIKADELSPQERSNLINAVVKLPDKYYSKDELNEKIAIIHLWLLHAVADEYKNATLSVSESNDAQLDDIEFENLPQILYVLPTPEVYGPNISFTFVVHNKWKNETFPVDIILTILNLHTENLKHLIEIEGIHFSRGLLLQNHDLLSVIIEKYGIILLSTCLITVGMILLLICIVIYYRRKTRHSAHCLTDDKLHRNMQEAMGLDLNPAVIILQDEIREKAALNGKKIYSLDDDEGWLAPIGDVPVEDNNAPFVQDTKL